MVVTAKTKTAKTTERRSGSVGVGSINSGSVFIETEPTTTKGNDDTRYYIPFFAQKHTRITPRHPTEMQNFGSHFDQYQQQQRRPRGLRQELTWLEIQNIINQQGIAAAASFLQIRLADVYFWV